MAFVAWRLAVYLVAAWVALGVNFFFNFGNCVCKNALVSTGTVV
jgi:hypothetical protein